MSTWEKRFAVRMNALHHTSSGNFEDLVKAEIHPVFESVKPFVTSGGFSAELMKGCENIRHYRFSLSQDMFIDLYFTRKGPCEVSSTFQLHDPFAKRRDAVMMEIIPLADVTEGWARQQFEVCLDEFLGEVEAMIGTGLPVVLDANVNSVTSDQSQNKPQSTTQQSDAPVAITAGETTPTPKPTPSEAPTPAPTAQAAKAPVEKPVSATAPAQTKEAATAVTTPQEQNPNQAAA